VRRDAALYGSRDGRHYVSALERKAIFCQTSRLMVTTAATTNMPQTKRRKRQVEPAVGVLPKRSHDLHYLFAGMAGSSRKRFIRNVIVSIFVGLVVSAALAGLLYLSYKP